MLERTLVDILNTSNAVIEIELQREERVELLPLNCSVRFRPFSLTNAVIEAVEESHSSIKDGDVLVVSSKFVSVSEGRFRELSRVMTTSRARKLALRFEMRPELAQLVIEESDSIIGGVPGFLLSINKGVLAPNAGIDSSNAPRGQVVLYPKNPVSSAHRLRRHLLNILKRDGIGVKRLGIIFSDSRITPTRLGTVGVAIATSGIRPTMDLRGKKDLFDNRFKFTLRALADQIATAAEICMGEATESRPLVIVRGVRGVFEKPKTKFEKSMTIPSDKCLIISGLRGSKRHSLSF